MHKVQITETQKTYDIKFKFTFLSTNVVLSSLVNTVPCWDGSECVMNQLRITSPLSSYPAEVRICFGLDIFTDVRKKHALNCDWQTHSLADDQCVSKNRYLRLGRWQGKRSASAICHGGQMTPRSFLAFVKCGHLTRRPFATSAIRHSPGKT